MIMAYQHYLPLICILFASTLRFIDTHNAPQDYVNAHNVVRKQIPGLQPLKWDPTVAKYAESYANWRKLDCALVHSNRDFGKYGENIAIGWGEFSGLDAVKLWVDEKPDYDYGSNSCLHGKMCGHYTQVVWKNTSLIGCARAKCFDNMRVFVTCNYKIPGNWIGEKPY
ncbi:hypothetical protein SSX86_009656 [Deinandra increscens subsp. villosa]|uniref:SCP domain-containing protein n=1 Tax=Deinandra increscens subsp. villosa TaxID=3103831 RepID=A0AAP0DDR2_9ASTR